MAKWTLTNRSVSPLAAVLTVASTTSVIGLVTTMWLAGSTPLVREELVAEASRAGQLAAQVISEQVAAAEAAYESDDSLTLIKDGKEVTIRLERGKITITENGRTRPLTSEDLIVEHLDFTILGNAANTKQGVTVSLDIVEVKDKKISHNRQFFTAVNQ